MQALLVQSGAFRLLNARTPCACFHAEASVSSGAQEMPAPDDFGEQGQNAVWASVRECPLSPTGSFRPDRVTIEWRQK